MDRQRVSTAFVMRDGVVLLCKRAPGVPTYANRWAAVSGEVEPGEAPEATAWRELAEETRLAPPALALVRAGLPVDIDDLRGKKPRRFRVHPFLFELAAAGAPTLDAAHTAFRWVAPDELIVMAACAETVPELDEALARVFDAPGALPPQFRAEAAAIFGDRVHGAAELAGRAAALVAAGAPAERVAALRPTMASVVAAARAAAQPGRDVAAELLAAFTHAAAAARVLLSPGLRVATISRSSTLLAALAGAPPVRLLVARSEPGGEGVGTAAAARAAGHDVELLPDEELVARVAAGAVDVVLVGADAITETGDVVNKIGTLALARAAARAATRFVVVADPWKRWPDVLPPPLEPRFEVVPGALIAEIVS